MNRTLIAPPSFDEAIMKCANTLHSKHNAEDSLVSLLQTLGEYYQADSCYIFEFNNETQVFSNSYQWHDQETDYTAAQVGHLPFSALEYFSADHPSSELSPVLVYETKNFPDSPDMPVTQFFKNFSIENIMIYPMTRKEQTIGLVGLTNIDLENFDNRLFDCGILFIQEGLHKREMHLQLSLLHNLDPLTGFFNLIQYNKKLTMLENRPPEQLGIVFIQMTGLEKTEEIYGAKYVDLKIKNATTIMGQFFDFPFYRIEAQKFVCFVLNVEEDSFVSVVDQLRMETSINSDACFTVGHTWGGGELDIQQEIARSTKALSKEDSDCFIQKKQIDSPTECLLRDLQKAIDENQFEIHLQAKVELTTEKIIGAEALVRRRIPKTGKLVPPDVFVPLYEHHSIVNYLDMHVLTKVCEFLQKAQLEGFNLPISVNFSRITLIDGGTAPQISGICSHYNVPTSSIQIEITERLGTATDDLSNLVVDDFKNLGFKLILDDFGSTYSNFLTLTKVDITEVKIDHSLIENMTSSIANQKILKSIINMCNTIGYTTSLAEGIETQEQKEMLIDLNCSCGQGFLFSHPLPMETFYEKYIK